MYHWLVIIMKQIKLSIINHQWSIINNQSGYTLIELLVVMAIAGILLSFVTINLLHVQQGTSLSTAEEMLIADIRSQQMKAIQGTSGGGSFGIHFSSDNTYALFQGVTYDASSPTNTSVNVDGPITFVSGTDIIFDSSSGAVHNFTSPLSITVTNTASSDQKTIQLNRYGVITQE